MDEEIKTGKISIGHSVNPKTFIKYTVKDGKLVESEFTVEGRKHTLIEVREKLLQKHKKYMRLNSDEYFKNISSVELHKRLSDIGEMKSNLTTDELKSLLENLERTRCIQLWHDGSTVANHSHILFSVNILYDVAVFYTDEEYENLYKEKMNLQGEIETPELYMIGRCASSDEQMGYVETRLEDLFELSKDLIIDDIKIHDRMRIFHGDGPAAQLEAGQQKGGHYFCPSCGVHLFQTDDISHCYQLKIFIVKRQAK